MHDASVRELSRNCVKVFFIAKRELIYFEGVVHFDPFHVQVHFDITKGLMANREGPRYAKHLNISF